MKIYKADPSLCQFRAFFVCLSGWFCLLFLCDLVLCVHIVLFEEFQSHSYDSNFSIMQLN